jgi:CSLREA domain-containing protein
MAKQLRRLAPSANMAGLRACRVAALWTLLLLGLPAHAVAAEITTDVTTDELNGDGDCSLREAVQSANTNSPVSGCISGDPGKDTVVIVSSGFSEPLVLSGDDGEDGNQEGDLDVVESVALRPGPLSGLALVDADFSDRVIDVLDGTAPVSVTLDSTWLQNGQTAENGGLIRSPEVDSSITLINAFLIGGSSGRDGGGIFSKGDLSITGGGVSGSRASGNGGGVENRGSLIADGVQFHHNAAAGVGGSIDNTGTFSVVNGISVSNSAASNGGGLAHRSTSPLSVPAGLFDSNRARLDPDTQRGGLGGAIFSPLGADLMLANTEIGFNQGGVPEDTLTHSLMGGAIHLQGGGALSITDGSVFLNEGFNGGAIASDGAIALNDTHFSENKAGKFGGAIMLSAAGADTQLEVNGGAFSFNEAGVATGDSGGAIYAQHENEFGEQGPDISVRDATFSSNVAHGLDGGAISAADGGTVSVSASTFDSNVARAGGAINIFAGTGLDLTNSTLVGNRTGEENPFLLPKEGGAIEVESDAGPVFIRHATIASNSALDEGGGIHVTEPAQVLIESSILAFNLTGEGASNCDEAAQILSGGHNLESHDTCGFDGPGDLTNTDPLLAFLDDNGGPTHTIGLYAGSPALEAIPAPAECPPPSTDQRGVVRPIGAGCDIGAFEGDVGPAPPVTPPPSPPGESSPPDNSSAASPKVVLCAGVSATQVGTDNPDSIRGTPGRDVIASLGGNDAITGLKGSDLICGGSGKDTLNGDRGNDKLFGEAGKDTLKGGPGNDKLKGGAGKDKQIQ